MYDTRYLLAIDPGKTSGVALWDITEGFDPLLIETDEYNQFQTCTWVELWCAAGAHIEIVMERYTIGDADSAWSLEIIGTVKYFAQKYGCSFTLQTPADAKHFSTDRKLKALDLWHKGGGGHANDALRHGLLYLVDKKFWHPKELLA